MLTNGEAGIDCANCDHQVIVHTQGALRKLKSDLIWADHGDPFCPGCGLTVWFEDYLDDA